MTKEEKFAEILQGVVEMYIADHSDKVVGLDKMLADGLDVQFVEELEHLLLKWCKSPSHEDMKRLCEYSLMYLVYRDKSVPEGEGVLFTNVDRMIDTYKKNHDYGDSFDKTADLFGYYAPATRMYDKINRLKTLMKNEAMVEESILDTFLDLANYCVLTLLYYQNKD